MCVIIHFIETYYFISHRVNPLSKIGLIITSTTCDYSSLATRGSISVTATAFIQFSDLLHCTH